MSEQSEITEHHKGVEKGEIRNPYCLVDGRLLYIEDHTKQEWQKLECKCPKCNKMLVARMGNVRVHHFYHKQSSNCVGGYESALHLLAKDLIASGISIMIPEYRISDHSEGQEYFVDDNHILFENSGFEKTIIKPDKVEVEVIIDEIRPDLLIEHKGRKLIIEILVTHAVDEKKRKRIEESGISAIEIDLSAYHKNELISPDEMKRIISESTEEKRWVFNKKIFDRNKLLSERKEIMILSGHSKALKQGYDIRNLGNKKRIEPEGGEEFVLDCPLSRDFDGLTYYSDLNKCSNCSFFNGYLRPYLFSYNTRILCSNKDKIISVNKSDFIKWAKSVIDNPPSRVRLEGVIEEIGNRAKKLAEDGNLQGDVETINKEINRYVQKKAFIAKLSFEIDPAVSRARTSLYALIEATKKKYTKECEEYECEDVIASMITKRWNNEIETFKERYADTYSKALVSIAREPLIGESFTQWFNDIVIEVEPFAPRESYANYVPWLWNEAKTIYKQKTGKTP